MITVLVVEVCLHSDCAIVLPICRKTTCRHTVAVLVVVVAKMELRDRDPSDSGLQNATFHCLFGLGAPNKLGLDLAAGWCNLISDRLSLIMSAGRREPPDIQY